MQNSHNLFNPSSSNMSPPDFYSSTNLPSSSYAQFGRNPFFSSTYNQYNFNSAATSSFSSMQTMCTSTFCSNIVIPSPPKCSCKRKLESPRDSPAKQHITEDRIAKEMSQLHISSQTARAPVENQTEREQRLYMCSEMQRLQTEEILPVQILRSINKPCTALIPWTPPIIPLMSDTESNNNNNNEEESSDNMMEFDSKF